MRNWTCYIMLSIYFRLLPAIFISLTTQLNHQQHFCFLALMDKRNSPISISDHVESWLEDQESDSSAVLSYIKQMLMEEDTEDKYTMFQDSLALQHTEKSFYEVIIPTPPLPLPPLPPPPPSPVASSSTQHTDNYPNVESPEQSLSSSSIDYSISSSGSSCGSNSNSAESSLWSGDEHNSPILPNTFPIPDNFVFNSNSTLTTQSSISSGFGYSDNSLSRFLDSTFLSNSEYLQQFERGLEQGTRFLPKHTPPFIVDQENATFFPSLKAPQVVVIKTEPESDEGEHFVSVSRGRKNREREEYEADGRSRKQSAPYMDESELSELFDKVVLGTGLGKGVPPNTTFHQMDETISSMFDGDVRKCDEEVVDLRTLLMLCAQAIASDSSSFAKQLVKQIKQHSSPIGDETQRLAHYFGNALEARLDGAGYQVYNVLSSKRTSAKDMIKAYYLYVSICPFEKLAVIFANNSIWNGHKNAETIHIIDFGIRYGFKWPKLISRLSTRPGGPPKIRITGIDMPQPGFRPDERVQETGRRLASYCKRFNVPFEFNAIAQRWDTIKVEDLKIDKNEFVAVNCMFQFEHLLDETVVLNNPRDAVLRLIKKANPDIFVHSIVNGCYDVPFFVSRFREALFHYSALFDMLDTNVAREDPMRLMFEKDLFGREIMNIIACEGCERVERAQTYKQWQLRNIRAGFRPLPLDHQVIDKLKGCLRDDAYNKNFMLEEDGNWVLQGWKGRIIHASSCWVPA